MDIHYRQVRFGFTTKETVGIGANKLLRINRESVQFGDQAPVTTYKGSALINNEWIPCVVSQDGIEWADPISNQEYKKEIARLKRKIAKAQTKNKELLSTLKLANLAFKAISKNITRA